ncbi:MAG: hypothetical protein A2252_06800 [Elusimicrobia bacterium RIFOXYA2_FULL_39_19]|nr:MAG: hypothetical protein A2252_06800 [Elusimicrobia bacterium RIFOXYA2_FULL_39_19]
MINITKEEKREVFYVNSSETELMISGILSSVTLCLIIFLMVLLFGVYIFEAKFVLLKKVLPFMLILCMAGIVTGALKKKEYLIEKKIPLTYLLLSFSIFIICIIELMVSVSKKGIFAESIMKLSGILQINFIFWLSSFSVFMLLSFILGGPLEKILGEINIYFLEKICQIDYRGIVNQKYFYLKLQEAFYNAKRYQVSFSIATFKIENISEIKNKFKKKKQQLAMYDELLLIMEENIRKTDISGYIKEGEVYSVIFFANKDQTEKVSERLKNIIIDKFSGKYGANFMEISIKVLGYSSDWQTHEEMIKSIMNEVVEKPDIIRLQ